MTFRWTREARALWERWRYFLAVGYHPQPLTLQDMMTFNELARRLEAYAEPKKEEVDAEQSG